MLIEHFFAPAQPRCRVGAFLFLSFVVPSLSLPAV
nr:MAG TPA: hypothetical protein [Caudoviricetes sp.]